MHLKHETTTLINAVNNEEWDVVASHLKKIIGNMSNDNINLICVEDKKTLTLWLKILFNSKMYIDNGKGEFLTKNIILKFWKNAFFDQRWDLLMGLLSLYEIEVCIKCDKESLEQFFYDINKKTGIPSKDIAEIFLWKSSWNMSNIVANDCSIQ